MTDSSSHPNELTFSYRGGHFTLLDLRDEPRVGFPGGGDELHVLVRAFVSGVDVARALDQNRGHGLAMAELPEGPGPSCSCRAS